MRDLSIPDSECRARHFGMVGRSPAMLELYDRIAKVAGTDCAVLIEGETGTGKDLVAKALHQQSRRSAGPFIPFNVATLSDALFESELFGHRKGAFSGASGDHGGLARAAHGGTLFMDEIGELPLTSQVKLLRFLDTGEVRRVGGMQPRRVDARVVCATNRDLQRAVEDGAMRPDLFFRLRVLALRVPRLRDRIEDLPLLVAHFVHALAQRFGKRIPAVSGRVMERLVSYDWPGNVRELKHELAQAVVLTSDGQSIAADVLSSHVRPGRRRPVLGPAAAEGLTLGELRRRAEREVIRETLERYGWNVTACARTLGISRVGLSRKLKRLGIRRPGRSARTAG